jgi:hypothetical protein
VVRRLSLLVTQSLTRTIYTLARIEIAFGMEKEKIITIIILIRLFGGLIGGPVASLADYYALPERRFWLFQNPSV